jgi:hypothetical protein
MEAGFSRHRNLQALACSTRTGILPALKNLQFAINNLQLRKLHIANWTIADFKNRFCTGNACGH